MAEAQKGFATLEDVDKGTFVRFIEWAHRGYYTAAEFTTAEIESPSTSRSQYHDEGVSSSQEEHEDGVASARQEEDYLELTVAEAAPEAPWLPTPDPPHKTREESEESCRDWLG